MGGGSVELVLVEVFKGRGIPRVVVCMGIFAGIGVGDIWVSRRRSAEERVPELDTPLYALISSLNTEYQ